MEKQPTIVERIRRGESLEITAEEMVHEVIRLQKAGDSDGMKDIFEAYMEWGFREELGSENQARIAGLVIKATRVDLDRIALLADIYLMVGDIGIALEKEEHLPHYTGPVTEFYRNATDYHPVDPNLE